MGDLQSEEERDVLLEMSLPATGEEARDWVVVYPKLTYFNVISSMMEEVAVDLKVQRCQEGKEVHVHLYPLRWHLQLLYYCVVCYAGVQQPNQSVLVQKLRVTTVETLKQAKELGSQGNSMFWCCILRHPVLALVELLHTALL